MCASEKQHCGKRAGTLTELDDFKGEEKNPLADTANRMRSDTTRASERSDFMKRKPERMDACDAGYLRCTRSCGTAATGIVEKAAAAK